MAVAYRQILRLAARRISAITGVTASALETAYMTSPLTSTQIGNANFTISMIIDNLVGVIGSIVNAYANVPNHPARRYNMDDITGMTNGVLLPSTSTTSKPIVGVFGAVRDSGTSKLQTKQPVQLIESILTGVADGSVKESYRYYDVVDGRFYSTCAISNIDVCIFSVTDQLAAVAANGNAPIPDALLDLAWIGLVSTLMIDDEFVAQAQAHRAAFNEGLAALAAGRMPQPNMMTNEAPAIS